MQGGLRAFTYVRTSGLTYGLSHFMALPFQWAHERLVFNDFERRMIGTPGPSAQLTMNNLTHNVLVPFGAMAASSGAGTVLVDGFYNAMPGFRQRLKYAPRATAQLQDGIADHLRQPEVQLDVIAESSKCCDAGGRSRRAWQEPPRLLPPPGRRPGPAR